MVGIPRQALGGPAGRNLNLLQLKAISKAIQVNTQDVEKDTYRKV